MKKNYELTGKSLFKAIYKLPEVAFLSQRFIIADSEKEAEKEIESYDCEYYTLDLIQDDISCVVLENEQ